MNTEHASNSGQASAGVPSPSAHTSSTPRRGTLDPFSQPAPTIPGEAQRERTVQADVSRTAKTADKTGPADAPPALKTVLTANPNRTKAPNPTKPPTRQEVNR